MTFIKKTDELYHNELESKSSYPSISLKFNNVESKRDTCL